VSNKIDWDEVAKECGLNSEEELVEFCRGKRPTWISRCLIKKPFPSIRSITKWMDSNGIMYRRHKGGYNGVVGTKKNHVIKNEWRIINLPKVTACEILGVSPSYLVVLRREGLIEYGKKDLGPLI